MSKKKKLKLENLSVQSFVTSLDDETANRAKGGVTVIGPLCSVEVCDTLVCSATKCPGPCPIGGGPTGVNPCNTVDKVCQPNSDSPCSGWGTQCTCYPYCQ